MQISFLASIQINNSEVNNLYPKKFIIMETIREEAPSSYLMKLVGFSEVKFSHQPYESADFDVGGHKWYSQPNLRSNIYFITLM